MNEKNKATLKKYIPVFIIVAAVIILGIITGFFKEAISSIRNIDEEPTTTVNTDVDIVAALMQDMHGAWLVEGIDFPSRNDSSKEEICASIDEIFTLLPSYYVDTIFVKGSDYTGETDFDPIEYINSKAKESSIYTVISIPAEFVFANDNSLLYDSSALETFVSSYDADAFILDGLDSLDFLLENDNESITAVLTNQIKSIAEIVKTSSNGALTGISVMPVWAHAASDPRGSQTANSKQAIDYKADTLEWAKSEYIDFVYIRPELEMANIDSAPAVVCNWWNEQLKNSETYAVWGINAALELGDEFVLQHGLISGFKTFAGIAFSSFKQFVDNPSATPAYLTMLDSELSAAISGVSDLVISKPENTTTVTSESTISFSGVADPQYQLFCNDIEIPRSSMGMFSIQLQLFVGENKFTFTHNGKTLIYTVTYDMDILTKVYPTGATQAGGGATIEIAALCHKNATLYAEISGTKIQMSPSGENLFGQSAGESDYVTFKGSFSLPNSKSYMSLGNIVFHASYNGIKDTMTGGEVAVLPELNTSNITDYVTNPVNYSSLYEEKSLPLKTAYQNHSLGTALMCEILKENTETSPEDAPDDKSHPFYTPLLKGTFDYVTGVATYDGEIHYILGSGRKIYAKEAKIIAEGNILPSNNLNVKSSSSGNSTEFIISTDWLVPVSVMLSPQSYYTGYQSRIFNVQQFTAEYLDITFHYTESAKGAFRGFSSNVIDKASWVNVGKDKTTTLRIQLKNAGRFYGYSVNMTDNGEFKISIKERNTSLGGKTIMLDPGHGGNDSGAIGVYSTIYESHINIVLANKVKAYLEAMGATVVMTRQSDTSLSLEERAKAASKQRPDLFISIHNDASTSSVNSGTHTFYYTSYSMPLAASIHQNMVAAYRNGIFMPDMPEYASIDLGIKFYPFAVTRITDCPAVLIECGFVTNAANCNALLTEQHQNSIANAIANGARDYFQNY